LADSTVPAGAPLPLLVLANVSVRLSFAPSPSLACTPLLPLFRLRGLKCFLLLLLLLLLLLPAVTGSLLVGSAFWKQLGEANSVLCDAEGFLLTCSSIMLNSWLLYIALSLLFLVRRRNRRSPEGSLADRISVYLGSWRGEVTWFVVWLGIGVFFAMPPLLRLGGTHYGRVGSGWCHIAPQPPWARFLLYPVQWGIIAAIIALYIAVLVYVKRRFPQQRARVMLPQRVLEKRRRIFAMLDQIALYPAVLLLSWVPTTIARIVGAATGHDMPWMSTVTALIVPMMGTLICICFLATSRVPQELWAALTQRLCPRATPDSSDGNSSSGSGNLSASASGYSHGSAADLHQPLLTPRSSLVSITPALNLPPSQPSSVQY